MSRPRSPSYPSQPLQRCVDLVSLIFKEDRTNPIDRETAVKHMGYAGLSGSSDKTLATLAQYGLLEKAGTGEVQVSQLAVSILHPDEPEERQEALRNSINSPSLFRQIGERFNDGVPSKAALESWLVREGYQNRAISPITRSYLDSMRYIEAEGVILSDEDEKYDVDTKDDFHFEKTEENESATPKELPAHATKVHDAPPSVEVKLPGGGSEWFRVKLGSGKSVTISLFGDSEVTPRDIDKLIIMLEAQKIAIED